ncbi:hypothetical protein KFL_001920150 [Klebsormidium nitens]|uniref:Thioredoxin domain-containing protein n=1 Tax=Klebsormidium nitens TaxID=105231 RepID=A0A1Y1I0S7_KLENI|nr:hypothetical protein KFL_001920150 [Klebsormidium nitens]|eukprot:GAQ84515.1 hypothetical protein KFL_001920150 [Klebsormidium nitens]
MAEDHGPVIIVTSKAHWDQLHQENAGSTVVVDFWATWCGPCKHIAPVFVELAKQYPHVVFLKVDVDENQDIAQMEDISAMPTFRVYKRGNKIDELIGASKEKLEQLVATNS